MTDVSGVSNTAAQTLTKTQDSRQSLSDNFDTFLKLLTAQLQNQDPLSPVDSAKFTEQLVQYSQVEQQIGTNEKLDALAAQMKTNANGAALSYLGKLTTFNSSAAGLDSNGASWRYALGANSTATTLTITDANGAIVYTAPGAATAGAHDFAWDGKKTNGEQAPNGVYTLKVSASDGAGKAIDTAVVVRELISAINLSGSTPTVTTKAGARGMDTIMNVEPGA
ncbi:MAG: flagellar hook assembly protein FlgD [Hyphomonadaceae bacterium]